MSRHRLPRERARAPWFGFMAGAVVLVGGLAVAFLTPSAGATPKLTPPAIVPGPLMPVPQPQPQPAALTSQDAPEPEREAFLHYLDQSGIDMTGRKDFAIDLGQLAAQSHAGDPELKQAVHILFPQLTDVQDGSFVDAVHLAFPDQG
jgi:hypothetical protein